MENFEQTYNDDEEIPLTTSPFDDHYYDHSQHYEFDIPSADGVHPPIPYDIDDFSAGEQQHYYHDNMQSPEENSGFASSPNYGIFSSGTDGPLLPDPAEMREEGASFREWRRNDINIPSDIRKENY
ncbi:hypothetical protein K7X08_011582 [Anisodus acutangulus]|uniref:Uncharacterized protein n=1 Tax=Anisodus acutangulus TaxID=402998 RepID=A0A9Q1MK99_9SOLA|nr:hypothetical protein K7X08_011582 [Anisodus acutangulus]